MMENCYEKFDLIPMTEVYYNEDTMYGVYKFSTNDKIEYGERTSFDKFLVGTVAGIMQRLIIGNSYTCTAEEEFNKKYDKWQYKPKEIIANRPTTSESKLNFLKCILTERQAIKLFEVYPNIVEMVIEGVKIDLSKVSGVKEKTFSKIKEKILDTYVLSDIISTLSPYGVTTNMIKKLIEVYPNSSILKQELDRNPYILTKVKGLGFKRVDVMAIKLNPNMRRSEFRVRAFIDFSLKEIGNNQGHSRIPLLELDNMVKENIGDCLDLYRSIIQKEMKLSNQLYIKREEVGLKLYYKRELDIFNKLKNLNEATSSFPRLTNIDKDAAIKSFKNDRGYDLTTEQISILDKFNSDNIILLTGKSGAGKSSSLDLIIRATKHLKVSMAAPSAKAARRMVELTNKEAYTIHKLLGFNGKSFEFDKSCPLNSDVVIVDEASMINSSLFLSLIDAIPYGAKLIVVFDDGQLPPIGVGNVASDLMSSDFAHIKLTKVHRQAEESGILSDGNLIREGINPIKSPKSSMIRGELKDMYYIFKNDKNEIFKLTINYFMKAIKSLPIEEVVICVPRKANSINCTATFNDRIQELLLGNEQKFIQKGNKVFKLGAKVIQRVNNSEKNVVNGEVGFVVDINQKDKEFKVLFDNDKTIEYNIKEMDEIELAYAITTHLSQGSQYNTVITVLDTSSLYNLISRNLIYTAMTRASKRGMIIAEPSAFSGGIKKCASKRNTWLQSIIKEYKNNL